MVTFLLTKGTVEFDVAVIFFGKGQGVIHLLFVTQEPYTIQIPFHVENSS